MRSAAGAHRFRGRVLTAAIAWVVLFAALALPMSPADAVPDETFADDFQSYSLSGSTGSIAWEGPWLEVGESDGVAAGTIQVRDEPNCLSEPCLVIGRSSGPDAWVDREVDLSGYASADLTFDYKIHWHPPGGGTAELSVSDDGGGSWSTLDTWPLGTTTDYLVGSYDLTPYLAENTVIRFGATDSSSESHINIDNLVITASGRQGYFDEFTNLGWDGSDGSIDWTPAPWQESEGDGEAAGLIQSIGNGYCANGNCLRIEGSTTSGAHNVLREVDLSGATFASLLFNYRRDNYNTCSIRLEVSDNGGSSWNHVTTYASNGGDAGQQSAAHDITGFAAPDTQVRFISNGTCTPGEFFFADNIWVYTDAAPSSPSPTTFYLIATTGGAAGGDDLLTEFDPADFNPSTNETSVGTGLGTWTAEGADIDPNTGRLYVSVNNEVGIVDTASGVFNALPSTLGTGDGSQGSVTFSTVTSLAFHPSNGDLYAVAARLTQEDLLLKVDPVTGAHIPGAFDGDDYIPIESLSGGRIWNPGIDFDPTTGLLYGISANLSTSTVATIDLDDGETNEIGDTHHAMYGLAFDDAGQLWGVSSQFGTDEVYSIDKATGAATNPREVDNGSNYRAIAVGGEPVPNSPPVFGQDLLDRSDAQGALISIASPATDPDVGDNLTYSATGLPEGISIDAASGDIGGALGPNSAGTHNVTITVVDSGTPSLQDTDTFAWTVTSGENLYLVAGTGGAAGGNDLLTAVDPLDFDPVTNEISIGHGTGTDSIYAATIDPSSGVLYAVANTQLGIIDPTTGVFSPRAATFGSGDGSIGMVTFSDVTGLVFDPASGFLFACHDAGAGSTLFRVDPATGAAIPGAFGGDDYVLIEPQSQYINATDLAFHPSTSVLYTVLTNHSNRWRLVTVDPATGATTAIGETVDWIRGLAFDRSGQLWGTTAEGGSESLYEISQVDGIASNPRVIDNGANYESIAFALEAAPNAAPVFDQDLLDRSEPEGTLIDVASPATDPNISDTLTYSATGLPEGIAIDPSSGTISGALGPNSAGIHSVIITVTDNGTPSLQDTDVFTWTVSAGEVFYLVANTGGANGGDDLLTAVNPSDPDPLTNEVSIGTGTGTTNIEAAAIQPTTNILFAVDHDQLGTIDITTGVFTALPSVAGVGNGAAGLVAFDNIEGLAFDPFTGKLYGSHRRGNYEEDLLFEFDPTTGSHIGGAFAGDDYIPIQDQDPYYHSASMAFDPVDGQLYLLHWTFTDAWSLATVDPTTGATTTLGSMVDDLLGLSFDGSGNLYASTATTSSESLHAIDKASGSTISSIAIDNGGEYEALAIAYAAAPNRPPVPNQDLLDRTDTEGDVISLDSAATDPDGHSVSYSAVGLPPGLLVNPISGLISGTIDFTAAASSPYDITITATDDGYPAQSATDTFSWTVNEQNRPPIFDQDLLDRGDAEGNAISLDAGATDPDVGDNLNYGSTGLPPGLSIDTGTGLITGTIDYTAAATSPYNVAITVTDDGTPNLSAPPDTFTWTVANTNRAPVIVNPGAQTTPELDPFSIVVTASDPDGTIPSLTDSATLPAWATLTDNGDGTATITGMPGIGGSGTTTVTITASDGSLSDDAVFDLTVTDTNVAPIIVNPGNQPGNEDSPFSVVVTASDPDGTTVSFADSGTLPAWATLTDNGDDTATISGTPGYDDAGTTTVTITASDGDLTDDAIFDIIIANTNRPPAVTPISDQSVAEGDALVPIATVATDPDGTIPSLSALGLPGWAGFVDNGDGTGTITGTPGYDDAATTTVTVFAFDGSLSGTTEFDLTVTNTNRAPVLTPVGNQSVAEGSALMPVTVTATDPDGTFPALAASGLPGWASLVDNGDGTGTITGTPGYDDAGVSTVTIYTEDGGTPNLSDTTTFDIEVTNTNRSPVLNPVANQTVTEGSVMAPITVTATDPDGTFPALAASGLPGWASLVDNGDGTGTITGTPGYDDAGVSTVTIYAEDGGTPNLSDTTTFDIDVTNTNRAPVLSPIPDQVVLEATALTPVDVIAFDPDGTVPALSATGLPAWAAFADNGDGTGTVTGTPGPTDAGVSTVTVTATDGSLLDTKTFDITVTQGNLPPVFDHALPDRTDAEGAAIALDASATDPDGDGLTYSAAGLPPGIAIDPATGQITGTLTYAAAGTHGVTINALDDGTPGLLATAQFTWTVTDTNRAPSLAPIPAILGPEQTELTFTSVANDPDGHAVTYSLAGAPAGSSIDPVTGAFTWTPSEAQGEGSYAFTVVAADNGTPSLSDTKTITITVTEVNLPPVVDPVGDQHNDVGDLVDLHVIAADPDVPLNSFTFAASGLPAGLSIHASTGRIFGSVAAGTPGTHNVTVTVTDDGSPQQSAAMSFKWLIGDTNHPPDMERIADRTIAELSPITIRPVATDPDGDGIRYEIAGAPPGSSFDAATGTFRWTPSEEQGPGTYRLSIIAADDGTPELVAIGVVAITVTEVNSAPTIESIPDRADDAGSDVSLQVVATDTDLPANTLTFSATDLPPGLSIDPATGAITGQITPTTDEVTHYSATATVTDDGDEALSASTEFTWTVVGGEVVPENFPPSVDPIAAQYSDAGATVGFAVQATDDGPVVFSASGLPAGLTIHPTTGVISGTVAREAIGTHAVVVTVADTGEVPLRTSVSFTWTVTDREAANQKDDVVVTITDTGSSPDEGSAGSVASDSRPIRRGLVVMSSAAVATTESMRLPMALLLALLVGFATIGRVGLYPLLWRGERHSGTLGLYDPELDFGLIHPDDGGEQVFVHANAFPRRQRATLATGMRIRYRVLAGDNRASAWGATTEVDDG